MTRREYLEKLNKAFGKFEFFEEDHHYECNGKRISTGVTTFIGQYENEFDAEGMAKRVAKKTGRDYQDILDEWEQKKDISCRKGSACHEYAQSLWNGSIWAEREEDRDISQLIYNIIPQADKFHEDYKDKLEHVADEYPIGDEVLDIASCIDHLFIDRETGGLIIVDYKTNTEMSGYNKEAYKKAMKVPLQELNDDALHHYFLQLSIYKYLVEKHTDIKVQDLLIVYMTEMHIDYEIIHVPYLEKEIQELMEWRKWVGK